MIGCLGTEVDLTIPAKVAFPQNEDDSVWQSMKRVVGEQGDRAATSKIKFSPWPNTVTAYLLQQIQLLAHRDRHGLSPWSATGNRSAKPTFQFGYEIRRAQRAPDALRLSQ
jgi:hypothetical protein